MYDKWMKLAPVFVFFSITLILAFLIVLSPAILGMYQPLDMSFILISLLLGISVISATVGIVAHKILDDRQGFFKPRKEMSGE